MIEVIDSTRLGWLSAIVCTIMPPIEIPTTCAASSSRWSRRAKASSAMSCMEYGVRALSPAKDFTIIRRLIRPETREECPVSRLS